MTLDTPADLCDVAIVTAPVPMDRGPAPCDSNSSAIRTINPRGRPRITEARPWDIQGISRSTYYERLNRKPTSIAPDLATLRWCVVAFFGQAEISATTELSRSGYETYLPMVAIRRRDPVIATTFHTVRVPYLPGYGFIRITLTESREPIVATRGIREILRRPDGKAAWVRDTEIEAMRGHDETRLKLPAQVAPTLPAGTVVRIERGAFAGLPGTALECDGVKTLVEVTMFGGLVPVWFDRSALEAV